MISGLRVPVNLTSREALRMFDLADIWATRTGNDVRLVSANDHVHSRGSAHYDGKALDFQSSDMDALSETFRLAGYRVLWKVPGHFGHVHVEEADGGPIQHGRRRSSRLGTTATGKRPRRRLNDDHTTVELDGRVIHQPGGFDQLVWIDWSDRRCGSARGVARIMALPVVLFDLGGPAGDCERAFPFLPVVISDPERHGSITGATRTRSDGDPRRVAGGRPGAVTRSRHSNGSRARGRVHFLLVWRDRVRTGRGCGLRHGEGLTGNRKGSSPRGTDVRLETVAHGAVSGSGRTRHDGDPGRITDGRPRASATCRHIDVVRARVRVGIPAVWRDRVQQGVAAACVTVKV